MSRSGTGSAVRWDGTLVRHQLHARGDMVGGVPPGRPQPSMADIHSCDRRAKTRFAGHKGATPIGTGTPDADVARRTAPLYAQYGPGLRPPGRVRPTCYGSANARLLAGVSC